MTRSASPKYTSSASSWPTWIVWAPPDGHAPIAETSGKNKPKHLLQYRQLFWPGVCPPRKFDSLVGKSRCFADRHGLRRLDMRPSWSATRRTALGTWNRIASPFALGYSERYSRVSIRHCVRRRVSHHRRRLRGVGARRRTGQGTWNRTCSYVDLARWSRSRPGRNGRSATGRVPSACAYPLRAAAGDEQFHALAQNFQSFCSVMVCPSLLHVDSGGPHRPPAS